LLVEDDASDAEFVLRTLRQHQVENPVTQVKDGIEALQVLRGEGDSMAGYATMQADR
jgi:CheY-like chemotaxis protein